MNSIRSRGKIIESRFRPAWWLSNGHAQTIWPSLMRYSPSLQLEWECLELPDNDFIDLAWCNDNSGPLVIVLHGLEGGIHSHYAKGLLSRLSKQHYHAVLMHFRGCSGRQNRRARSYHSGETGDLKFLIKTLKERYPERKFAAVGFSLGGNVLLKYLGEEQDNSLIDSAVAISVPFDLAKSADRLNRGFSRIYQWYLLSRLQKKTIDKFSQRDDAPFDIKAVMSWNNFTAFDNYVTAPLHGFRNSREYYDRCSSRQFLKTITRPTLILQAEDDPFLPLAAIPGEDELCKNVILELSRHGGHVGFISGKLPWRPCYWLEQRITEFLHDHL